MKIGKNAGAALALAAASIFAAAPMAASAGDETTVHCYGVNKCAGHNDCKTAKNACKGHASCQGQGFVTMSKRACDAIGGKVGP
jgi:uncharacterized membrane protein